MTKAATAEPQVRQEGHPWRVTSLQPAWRVRPRRKTWFVRTPDDHSCGVDSHHPTDSHHPSNTHTDHLDRHHPTDSHHPSNTHTDDLDRHPTETCDRSELSPSEMTAPKLVDAFARALASAQTADADDRSSPTADRSPTVHDQEHGSRDGFLAEARRRLGGRNAVDKIYPLRIDGTADTPRATYGTVPQDADASELVTAFTRTLEDAGGVCHLVGDELPELLLDYLVSEFEAWEIVVSAEPEACDLAERLAERGAEVHSATPAKASRAVMGITSASAGIAATGSIVLDSSHTGSRGVSALPRVHVCVLPADRIVASPSDVLRPLGDQGIGPAASLTLVTGPSRSGDSEQILTVGPHGPRALHVIVVGHEGDAR